MTDFDRMRMRKDHEIMEQYRRTGEWMEANIIGPAVVVGIGFFLMFILTGLL